MKRWIQILWQAMEARGEGYRRHSLKHTGEGTDRRNDKLRDTPEGRVPFNPPEGKLVRAARLGKL